MPVPEERLYKPDRLNKWFAITSVLMTVTIFWLIMVDYNRPWREFQDHYFVGKAALAHLDYLDAMRQERQQEIADAKQRLKDVQQYVAETDGAARAELESDLVEADLKFRQAEGPWSRLRQVLDVSKDTYERALEIKGPNHPDTVAARQTFQEERDTLDRLRKEKEHWEDLKRDLQTRIRAIDKPVLEAEARVASLQKVADDAAEKDRQFRGVLKDTGLLGGLPIVGVLINFPLLDFTAPKNTPSRNQVNQLVLPEVRQRLNYLETYTTDRCTTCHIAIDDPDFAMGNLASQLERSLPGINEALQRDGRDPYSLPSTPVVALTGEPLPPGQVTEHWGDLTKEQRKTYFEELLTLVNRYLKSSGRKEIELGQPLLAHPDLDLYVNIDSPHPMNKLGCTVCHEGNPQETDFVQAAHSPPTHKIQEEWEQEYYLRELGVPNVTFETVSHYWDRTMRLPEYTEAGCAKCHSKITDVARFDGEHVGSRINLGEHLFREVGCINCHNVEDLKDSRKVGPDLTYIAAKLDPEFVQPWAMFPKNYRPSTLMPSFFLQENNGTESANNFDPHPVLRTETEVAAISKYLFAVSQEWAPLEKPEGITGDVERGRMLFRRTGCTACHANLAEFGEEWITADLIHREGLDPETALFRYKGMTYDQRVHYAMEHFVDSRETIFHPGEAQFKGGSEYTPPIFTRYAPELSGIGSKVSENWLYSWLLDPTQFAPDTKMPNLRLSPAEAADLAAYLATLRNDAFIQEAGTMTTERLSMADDLIFDLLSAQRSERQSRAIMNDEGDELTQTLVQLLKGSLGKDKAYDLIRAMSLEDKKLMFLGNKAISHYGCYACHKIAGFESASAPGTDLSAWAEKPISQLDFGFYDHAFHHMREERDEVFGYVYPRDAERLNHASPLPSDAREQITHTHAAFAKYKLLNPRIWDRGKLKKPYEKLKMPNFFFSDRESEALTTYLLSRMPPRVTGELKVDYEGTTRGPIADGRFLTRELNCVACHQVEDNVPTIQQYFRREAAGQLRFDESNAPPSLIGEGAKIQYDWLHRFLDQVEPLRPWLEVRMPTFNITSDQATKIAAYFASLSQYDAARLDKIRASIDEHVERARKADVAAGETEDAERAGEDWFTEESLQKQASTLERFAIERRLMRESELDSLTVPKDRLVDAHRELLKRIDFIRDLYDVPYPFVEPPAPLASPERLELGMQFISDMGCLKCHVLGPMLPGPAKDTDEFVQVYRLDGVRGEGAEAYAILNGVPRKVGSVIDGFTLVSAENIYYDSGDVETKAIIEGPKAGGGTERIMLQAASAPNLGLTYERLRRAWVHDWMLNPQWIQPGTKMPQNFAGGVSPFEGDPTYPGSSADQINLLVDTLFDAGRSNLRAVLPKLLAPSESEEFEEGGGDEFFDE